MKTLHRSHHSLPNTQKLTIVAQDPSIKLGGRILTAQVEIPAEELLDGPCGYRVSVIDYDATSNQLYEPTKFELLSGGASEPSKVPSFRMNRVWRAVRQSGRPYVAACLPWPMSRERNCDEADFSPR